MTIGINHIKEIPVVGNRIKRKETKEARETKETKRHASRVSRRGPVDGQ